MMPWRAVLYVRGATGTSRLGCAKCRRGRLGRWGAICVCQTHHKSSIVVVSRMHVRDRGFMCVCVCVALQMHSVARMHWKGAAHTHTRTHASRVYAYIMIFISTSRISCLREFSGRCECVRDALYYTLTHYSRPCLCSFVWVLFFRALVYILYIYYSVYMCVHSNFWLFSAPHMLRLFRTADPPYSYMDGCILSIMFADDDDDDGPNFLLFFCWCKHIICTYIESLVYASTL